MKLYRENEILCRNYNEKSKERDSIVKETVEQREYQIKLQKLISQIAIRFTHTPIDQVKEKLIKDLAELGNFFKMDYCYIFEIDHANQLGKISYLWSRLNNNEKLLALVLRLETYTWWGSHFQEMGTICIHDIADYPIEAQFEKSLMAELELKSLLAVPMISEGTLYGYLGFGSSKKCNWIEDQISLLEIIAGIFVSQLEKWESHMALKAKEERYRALALAIPDLMLRVKQNGMIIDVKHHANFLDFSPGSSYIGKNIKDLLPEEVVSKTHEHINKALREHSIETFEIKFNHMEHTLVEEARVVAWGVDEVIIIIRDVSERRDAELKLLEAGNKLSQAQRLTLMGVMAASVLHDLNQPLNAIKVSSSGLLYLSKQGFPIESEQVFSELEHILKQVKRIEEVMSNIRDPFFSQSPLREEVNLGILIDEIKYFLHNYLEEENIMLEVLVNASCPVWVDPGQFRQLLFNLIENAVEAIEKLDIKKIISVKAWNTNSAAFIEVSDNGLGILDSTFENLFDPFFTTKHKGRGSGIGLTIVKAIIENHGGKILAFNNNMGGATFRLEFPLGRDVIGGITHENSLS
jgi:PAS domain S-box-containing protein